MNDQNWMQICRTCAPEKMQGYASPAFGCSLHVKNFKFKDEIHLSRAFRRMRGLYFNKAD